MTDFSSSHSVRTVVRHEPPHHRRLAFSLIELMIVVAIISVLGSLILTAVGTARDSARRVKCVNNLRQMVIAATMYELDYGMYPPAFERDFETGETRTWEAILWDADAESRIQQCPSFHGEAMWEDDRYTGYNYNASYVGGTILRRGATILPASKPSACRIAIGNPSTCALFGDGEYECGANKFMRSPYPGDLDTDASLALGGTQGYRHRGKTNVGFADGHVESLKKIYTDSAAGGQPARGCGFLSPNNSLYDLD